MKTRDWLLAGGIVLAVIVAALIYFLAFDNPVKHRATCWQPSYAAHPTVSWARDPSVTHRHGRGPLGVDVCDKK